MLGVLTYLYPTNSNSVGGIFVKDEVELLSTEKKIKVFKLDPYKPGQSKSIITKSPGVEYQSISYFSTPRKLSPALTKFFLTRSFKKILNQNSVDCIHGHALYPAGLVADLLKLNDLPFILTIHGSDWHYNKNKRRFRNYIKKTFDQTDKIIAVSKSLKEDICNFYPEYTSKIVVLHNFVSDIFFTTPLKNNDNKEIIITCVTNLYPVKGVDILLKSISESSRLKSIPFNIVYSAAQPAYFKRLKQLESKHKLDNIRWHYRLNREQIIELLDQSSVYVQPSRNEGFGKAVVEAGARGLPIVGTEVGIIPDIINDTNGLICNACDYVDLKEKLEAVTRQLYKYKRREIIDQIKNDFSPQLHLDELNSIYNAI